MVADKTRADNGPLSFKKRLLFHAVPYLALLIILLAIEGYVRVSLPSIPSIQVYVTGNTHGDSDEGAQTFEGDPLLGWRLKSNLENQWWEFTTFDTNGQHLRHPGDIKVKAPDVLRIVCLGDSVTFGYRVPVSWKQNPLKFNDNDLPYPRLLEHRINNEVMGIKAEVIAMAVPGYSSHQGLAWLQRDIEWLRPDIVTVNFGWNDSDYRPAADKETLTTRRIQVFLRWLSAHSQAVVHAARWLRKMQPGRRIAKPVTLGHRVAGDDYVANMLEIARVAKTHGAKPLIIAQVYQNANANPPQAKAIGANRVKLTAAAEQAGIPFLNNVKLTEAAAPANRHLFGELIHPDSQGHKRMADDLFDFLIKFRGWDQERRMTVTGSGDIGAPLRHVTLRASIVPPCSSCCSVCSRAGR